MLSVGEKVTVRRKPLVPDRNENETIWEITIHEGENHLPNGDRILLLMNREASSVAIPENCETYCFRAEAITLPFVAGSRRMGDFLHPRRLERTKTFTKKIQDIFVDAKVPRETRSRKTILRDSRETQEVMWIPGIAVSHEALTSTEVIPLSPETRLHVLAYG